MRISDWSSDVCSSDLPRVDHRSVRRGAGHTGAVFFCLLLHCTVLLFVAGPPTGQFDPMISPRIAPMLPWTERNGALSPFRLTCFLLLCLPALWLAAQALAGMLGARPYAEAIHQAGQWAVRLILITLAVTPFRRLLRWPKLVMLRRQIGVAAMCYALLHLTLYTASEAWMLGKEIGRAHV